MSPMRSISMAGVLLVLGVMPAGPGTLVGAQVEAVQAKPMEVTTDTPEYCLHLTNRVSELARLATAPVPHEVTELSAEGQRMCAHGQTRGGIMRLRSALRLMERWNGPADR